MGGSWRGAWRGAAQIYNMMHGQETELDYNMMHGQETELDTMHMAQG